MRDKVYDKNIITIIVTWSGVLYIRITSHEWADIIGSHSTLRHDVALLFNVSC